MSTGWFLEEWKRPAYNSHYPQKSQEIVGSHLQQRRAISRVRHRLGSLGSLCSYVRTAHGMEERPETQSPAMALWPLKMHQGNFNLPEKT